MAKTESAKTIARQILKDTKKGTGVPTRILGRTGERVSILCLGGWHIGAVKQEKDAFRIMHTAIGEGLTFFDNAWDYHDGHSEEVMGKALAMDGLRKKVFLMTKNCERDYAGSMKNLEDSLRRMKTDCIDLWQFHECNYDNDPDWIFDKGGMKAALEAKKQGKIRFLGFTGHKDPSIHLNMLAKYKKWDTSQMPINVGDAVFRSFQNQVMPLCLEQNVGVIGMKGLGGGYPQGLFPEVMDVSVAECYRYALSLPVATQVMGILSLEQLQQNLALVRNFEAMGKKEREALVDRIREQCTDWRHETFKSTQMHDGPHHRRQHGFAA